MRILELLREQIDTKIKDSTTSLKLKSPSIERKERDRVLGRGIANLALDNKRDPHTIIRHNSNVLNPAADSSNVYYAWLAKSKAFNENPYFPRIYEKVTVSDKDGRQLIKYEIEKLSPIESLDSNVIRGITNALFDQNFVNRILKLTAARSSWHEMEDEERALVILLNCLEDVFYGRASNDENLNDAMKTAKELSYQNAIGGSDIHRGNVMVRFTPHGPQLVLTDPI